MRRQIKYTVVFAALLLFVAAMCTADSEHQINLRSYLGMYLTAEDGGGGVVNVNRPNAFQWETFTLIDLNGGTIESLDSVQLRTFSGRHFMVAENGGGSEVQANREQAAQWETFKIIRICGRGEIRNGDAVALQTHTGHFLSAVNGGGGGMLANRTSAQQWETFVLYFPDQADDTQRPNSIVRPSGYKYLGNYPKDRENGWSDELQGVTHDESFWYFTNNDNDENSTKPKLWRFPVWHDLNRKVKRTDLPQGVRVVDMPTVLKNDGYDHFGDLDCYSGFLFIATEGKAAGNRGFPPIVAVFEAVSLRYVGHFQLPRQMKAGWCAVRPVDERLYSSDGAVNGEFPVFAYDVDWELLKKNNLQQSPSTTKLSDQAAVQLLPNAELVLRDENGYVLSLNHMQGGVFSENDHLYTVNGFARGSTQNTGIMAFDLSSGRRFVQSTNGHGDFNFEYHPYRGSKLKINKEEPEGITLWDLSAYRDSKSELQSTIKGQIHIIMIDNYPERYGPDDFYFKHYEVFPPDRL